MNDLGAWIFLGVSVNALAFAAFGWDKLCARRGKRRLSERTLLALCGLGGFIGGLAGMIVFRHKTAKRSFQLKLALLAAVWATVAYLALR